MLIAFIMIVTFFGLILAEELFRRFKLLSLLFFVIMPLIFLPWWIDRYDLNWFFWAKMLSIITMIGLLYLCRQTKLGKNKWLYLFIWVIFLLNILEAVLFDVLSHQNLQLINVFTGIILILTIPGPNAMQVDESSPSREFTWDIPFSWILTYTLWNWLFVYGNWPGISAIHHIAILGSALTIAILNRKWWMEARAFTLGTYFLIWFLFEPYITNHFSSFEIPSLYNYYVYLVIVSLTFSYSLTLLYNVIRTRIDLFATIYTPIQIKVSQEDNLVKQKIQRDNRWE